MSRVLLSFLGTGPLASTETRTYKTVNYHLGDAALGDYPFVSAALKKHYKADKIILIGTAHSMWEEVYRWFCVDSHSAVDDDIYFEIADACENANYQSPLSIPHQDAIERALGKNSKIVLIHYGLNEQEITDNINIVLGLQNFLNNNDELIVDITHAFRSLPIFMMNLLIYLQNVASKKITISHIHYGMLEISKELGFAPIIDLKAIMDVNDWITGAYSFAQFGNAYKIAQLMNGVDRSVPPLLNDFSDLMNLNHLSGIQSAAQRLSAVKNNQYSTLIPQLIITPVVNGFIDRFSTTYGKHSVFQLKVARWQLEHRKYAQSLLSANEAIITYVCELNGLDWNSFDNREFAKKALSWHPDAQNVRCNDNLKGLYKRLKPLRNLTAHTLESDKSVGEIIRTLSAIVGELEDIIHE